MKSTSISRSRHASRYSSLVVRTIVLVSGARFREKIAAIRLISSRDVQAIIRSDSRSPASWRVRAAGAVPLDRRDVEAIRERRESSRVEVDDRHVVLAVQCLDDRCPHLPGSDHEDPHDETG